MIHDDLDIIASISKDEISIGVDIGGSLSKISVLAHISVIHVLKAEINETSIGRSRLNIF